jgi:hypothetical protein
MSFLSRMETTQNAMFRVRDLDDAYICRHYLHHLTLRGQAGLQYGAWHKLTRLSYWNWAGLSHGDWDELESQLLSLMIEDAPEAYGILEEFTFVDQLNTEDVVTTIEIHAKITCTELTRCTAPLSAWEIIIPYLRDLADSGLKYMLLKDCVFALAGTIINCRWDYVQDGPVPATFQFHIDFYSLTPPTDATAAPDGESLTEEIPRL